MGYKRAQWNEQERAGMKAIAGEIMGAAERVAVRYKNQETRNLCHCLYSLGEAIISHVDSGDYFEIQFLTQMPLPGFDLSDEAYGYIE